MAYNLPDPNSNQGLIDLLVYMTAQIPYLMPLALFFIFLVITISGYYYQERKVGKGNIPMWLCIGSFITTTGAIILFLIPNLLDIETVLIGICLTILFTVWFLLSEKE